VAASAPELIRQELDKNPYDSSTLGGGAETARREKDGIRPQPGFLLWRPPIAQNRLSLTGDGEVLLQVRHTWTDGMRPQRGSSSDEIGSSTPARVHRFTVLPIFSIALPAFRRI